MISVWECDNPEVSRKHLQRKFVPYPHYIVFDFEAVFKERNLDLTSDLTIDCSHIPVSIAINDSLTNEPIFIVNQESERLIEEFVAELISRQGIILRQVWNNHPMVDEESLPKRVQKRWINWVNQVLVFGVNSRKYDLNLVREYFVRTLSNMNDVTVVKKDNSYMFLTTPIFKFLDVTNYLAPGLSYDGWCKVDGCAMEKLAFPYEWLDDYEKLSHVRPVEYENFYSKLKAGFMITLDTYAEFVREFNSRGCVTMMNCLQVYNEADVNPFIKAVDNAGINLTDYHPPGHPGAFAPKCVPSPRAFAQHEMLGGQANK